ncbi:MAG: CDP-diacylglycerol--glycerol-3-phosphate 3-phosphatidyltransferase [Eggerthellaceae bacterium]|nr:CDP-diacylglycerol--glycerol-3-phosphate 3-phosphatidyltransferase [Eggerthellaceae bacterium]
MTSENKNDELWTPANKVTLIRVLFIPVFVVVLLSPWPEYFSESMDMHTLKPWLAAAVFIIISMTDMLDGYLARSRGEVTDFGKFMDPIADKMLVAAALLALIELDVIPSWVVLIIIVREFIVSGVRMIAASKGEVIAASWYGKIKTVFQMIAIVLFIVKDSHVISDFSQLSFDWLYIISWIVMAIALVFTVLSMVDYLYKARYLFGFGKKKRMAEAEEKESDAKQVEVTRPVPSESDLRLLAEEVLLKARAASLTLATAESCTGGYISEVLTAIPGSSDVYSGGVVSYSNDVKHAVLGVGAETLKDFGAVSEEVACEMARGVRNLAGAHVAVSVTGIAGPDGGSPEKPVGTVWIGISDAHSEHAHRYVFPGNRDDVRAQTVEEALRRLLEAIT